jgi:hypothetical protein
MSKLKDLKEEFTKVTGLPAKKAVIQLICPGVDSRSMHSISDWEWVLTSIEPRFKLQTYLDLQNKLTELEEQNEVFANYICKEINKPEPVEPVESKTEVADIPAVESLEDVAYLLDETESRLLFTLLLSYANNLKSAYKKLAKKYHPDVNSSPKATALTVILNDVYSTLNQQKDNSDDNFTDIDYTDYDYATNSTVDMHNWENVGF